MMNRADITALMKGLRKRAHQDVRLMEAIDQIEEISEALADADDEEPRIRVPYVNVSAIGTGTWK